jgi:hypothetical protein
VIPVGITRSERANYYMKYDLLCMMFMMIKYKSDIKYI